MSNSEIQFERLAIIGVGLIGGSIAAAAKARNLARTVLGYGRNRNRLEQARACGVIDLVGTEPKDLQSADLIVVCTPVDQIARDVCMALEMTGPATLVTDGGSVKGSIVRAVQQQSPNAGRYIPAHPLAGSHLTGFENANSELYQDRLCVLTPTEQNSADSVRRIHQFWQGIGMRTSEMSVDEHDRILAMTSHLPHLAAASVASLVETEILEFAAGGYRDTTRVAAGDPGMWTAIFSENKEQMLQAANRLIDSLQNFREMLAAGDRSGVNAFLARAKEHREQFRDRGEIAE